VGRLLLRNGKTLRLPWIDWPIEKIEKTELGAEPLEGLAKAEQISSD
jgi:hypothetical protein